MTFGYYDKRKYKGDIEWYPNNSTTFFTIHLDDILFGNVSMKDRFCKNKTGMSKDPYFKSHEG